MKAHEKFLYEEIDQLKASVIERDDKIREVGDLVHTLTTQLADAQLKMTLTPDELAELRGQLEMCRKDMLQLEDEIQLRERCIKELEGVNAELAGRGREDMASVAELQAEVVAAP